MGIEFSQKESVETYSEGTTSEQLTLRPVMLALVGDVSGKTVLDMGCGDGRYSLIFAQNGARVIATDASEHQIEIAQQRHAHPNIAYNMSDVSAAPEPASVDVAFANLVVPSLSGTDKLDALVSTAKRTLKPGGKFIFSVLHPLYIAAEQDTYDKSIDFKPENYFMEGSPYKSEALTNAGNKMRFNESHFSLTRISESLRSNVFLIRSVVESRQIPEKRMFLPKYLAFECVVA
ncbi:MAG: class I SAM-dependent methyltransferase [Patescibacteria group bacterium]